MTPRPDLPTPDYSDDHDEPVGTLLSRRDALALLGTSGLLWLAGCARDGGAAGMGGAAAPAASSADGVTLPAGACVARPELTEGPYYVDVNLDRSDIRSDPAEGGAVKPGMPLRLTFNVSRIDGGGCAPLSGAMVEVWQCDALGVYSSVNDPGFRTLGEQFLRGHQRTDANGVARFTTIYPGWYRGRAVHIHFKVRSPAGAGRAHEFTSQLFFPDELTDRVHAQAPYAQKGQRDRRNAQDGIYRQGGAQLLLDPVPGGDGYDASFAMGLQLA